jgi:exopolyphosphatase/pppGpp-phosphohydrolase
VTALEPGERVVGTGGTIRNLAKVERRAREYPVTRLHGYVLSRKGLKEVVDLVTSRKAKKRAEIPGLNDDRGDSIVGGGLAIRTLLELLEADEVCVSGQGVREGLARSLMGGDLLSVPEVRRSSVRALASRFVGWDEESATRRVGVADQLLTALELSPDPDVREGLFLAALVLDVGRSVDFFDRHEHVADIVLATDLLGFTHRGVALLSAVLRAAGDEDAQPRSYAPLVNGKDLHERCIVEHHLHDLLGGVRVFSAVADHDDQFRAAASGLPDRHTGPDAEGPGLVGAGGDDRAMAAAGNGNRLAPQIGVGLLLHRGEKGIHIHMHDNPAGHG